MRGPPARFSRRRPPRCCSASSSASGSASASGSRLHLRRGRAVMAYCTVQRVALASGLVLAVSLLLPKAFLSRGKRQEPPPAPEGKRTPAPGIPAMSRENAARGRGERGRLPSPLTCLHHGREKEGRRVFGRGQASRFPWHHLGVGPTPPALISPDVQGPGMRAPMPEHSPVACTHPSFAVPSTHWLSPFRCSESGGLPPREPPPGFCVLSVVLFFIGSETSWIWYC